MANNCSKIILDAHSATANPLKTTPASDIQQLPPPPIWTAMVKGTLEYLRLAWDCLAPEEPNLGIFVAGQRANCICTEQAGDCTLSKVSINLGKTGPERLHDAPEKLRRSRWHFVLGNAMTSTIGRFNAKKYSRIILLLMSDGTTSMESQVTALSKDIVTAYIRNQNCYEKIDFNVVRICWEEKEHLMPDMHKRLLNDRVNVYIHNVPVSMDDIMQSMRNLAQLHCSLKSVRITQIPMNKTSSADLSTQQVTFLYRDTNLSESEKSLPSKRLFDPVFWGNRERELVYVKRSKRPIQMNGWCTRILSLVAADLDYAPAEVYIKTTLGGSSSYLVTSEAFRGGAAGQHAYTHTLVGDNGKLLLCIYEQVEDPLEQLEFVVKKEEGGHQRPSAANVKSEHLLRDVVAPSTDQMPAPSLTVERDPLQYAPQASYHTLLQTFPPMTALWSQDLAAQSQPKFQMGLSLEKSTKWLTCFRDSVGTEEFGVEQDDRSVADTARDVANGEPLSNGYEFILDLMPPMSDNLGEIWKIMMKNQISNAEKGPIKATISNTIKELWDIMEKRSKRNLARNDLQEGGIRELTAKRILVALCLVGWRFRDDSPSHKEVCQYMLSLIIKPEQQEANIKIQQQEQQASAEDMAWQQATSYQNMTLQEQANAVYQDSLEDAPMRQMQPNPQQQQRGGRYNRTKRWPDHTVIQPYLNAAPASKEEREQRAMHEAQQIGPPGSALWYINTMRAMALSGKRSGDDQDDGTILSYKKGRWIRRQKEFDGYLGY